MNEELRVIISAEVSRLKQGVENAKQSIKNFGSQVEEAKKNVDANFKAIGDSINAAATTMGVGIAAVGAALLANVSATEEYRNQQAQLITAFETAGASADAAKETYNGLYRVLGDSGQAQEAAQHLAKLTNEEKALNEWTTICQGVYATFGASLPIESLTEAANETAKTGSLTGALADSLNWAGVSEEAFQAKLDACNTEAEREALIRETLNGLYSEASANYETNNAAILAQRDAQASLQEKLAALGEALAPVITAFTAFAGEALALVVPHVQTLAAVLIPLLQTALDNVITSIQAAAGWIQQNTDLLTGIGVAIGIVVAAITAYNTVAAVKAAMAAAEVATLGALVAGYAAQAAAMAVAIAPYLLVAAAIAAVIAIILNWGDVWEWIKGVAAATWEWIQGVWAAAGEWFAGILAAIQEAFAPIGEWFSNLFTNAWLLIQAAWGAVVEWFSSLWESVKAVFTPVADYYKTIFADAWNNIKSAWSGVKSWFSSIWNSIKAVFKVVGSWFGSIFKTAFSNVKAAFSTITGFFSGIWEDIKTIFSDVGTAIADGIKGAVSTAVNGVLSTAANIINVFIRGINAAISIINAIPGVSIGYLSELGVPAMAKGGIVDSATLAVVGEQGKEAVVPLENNLEWLDKLAGMLNDRMGGSSKPIVLNVDGKRFGEIAVDSINGITRQRGSIPLVLA